MNDAKPRATVRRPMPVCAPCWNEHNPQHRAPTCVVEAKVERCIICEEVNADGIYVRMTVVWE